MALFITFEGGEGSGKSTQVQLLADRLRAAGLDVTEVREPGSTRLGWEIRDWLKRGFGAKEAMSRNAELFLFAAARSQLVAKVLRPALDRPEAVAISDRYADSTMAYQGYGRGISLEEVKAVNDLATQGVEPDLTILLDCDPLVGLQRALQMPLPLDEAAALDPAKRDEEGTRFEEGSREFHKRVREGYLDLARSDKHRWRVVDANRPPELIAGDVLRIVKPRLSPVAQEMVETGKLSETVRPDFSS